jgi:hypothetical protein
LTSTTSLILITSTFITTSSPITTATVTNYLGTTIRSQTISVINCSSI